MSFNLDQECRHAMERIRVSVEANTAYELKKMRAMYEPKIVIKINTSPFDVYRQRDAMRNAWPDLMSQNALAAQSSAYAENLRPAYLVSDTSLRSLFGIP